MDVSASRSRMVAAVTPLASLAIAAAVVGTASAANADVWDRLAACESGGDWQINTGNGYYGGLQFSLSSWRAVGGSGYPHQASVAEQKARARRLQDLQGWGAWPACSAELGLSGDPAPQPEPAPEPEPAPAPDPDPPQGATPAPQPAAGVSPDVDPVYPADEYRIRAGETLAGIAGGRGVTVARLVEANPRTVEDPDLIYPGEGLFIP